MTSSSQHPGPTPAPSPRGTGGNPAPPALPPARFAMGILARMAARNLVRNLRRTLITTAAIAFGLALIHLANNMNEGTYQSMMRTAISTQAGHIVVQPEGVQAKADPLRLVEGADGLAHSLEARFPGSPVLQRAQLPGLLSSPANSVGVGLLAIQPTAEARVTPLHEQLVEGEWLAEDDDRGVILGVDLARKLKVGVGDKVVLMGQGKAEVTSRLLRVRGFSRVGAPEVDGFTGFITIPCARAFYHRPDTAGQLSVHLPSADGTAPLAAEVSTLLARPDLEVLDWPRAIPEVVEFVRADRVNNAFTMSVLLIIVAIGVLNTVLMSVMERVREFGVLLALGVRPRQVASIILLESLFLGLFASVLGALIGAALSYPLVTYGLDYSEMLGGESMDVAGVRISARLFAAWDWKGNALYALGAIAMTLLAGLWPAWTAARLRPVEAMHHV